MLSYTTTLTQYIVKHYNINISDATNIVEDEWDYIEQIYLSEEISMESIAQDLIDIYMVA